MVNRRYAAIIFDLFGTLVDNIFSEQDYLCLTETAQALGVETRAFIQCWTNDGFRTERRTGVHPTVAAEVEQACRYLGILATSEQIRLAVQTLRTQYGLPALTPRPEVVETLNTLKNYGFALCLVSDCSRVVTEVWEQSAFAGLFHATIFSCVTGARKPDPRLYQAACAQLNLSPERCLYIGDGDGHELTSARRFGMDAMLICTLHERDAVMQREEARQWDGPVIERIEGVWDYL